MLDFGRFVHLFVLLMCVLYYAGVISICKQVGIARIISHVI